MTISIVNGYTCETGCEVAKAKAGQDPHPTRRDPIEANRETNASGVSAFGSPAVTFGGSLAELLSASAVAPAASAANASEIPTRPPPNTLDLLV